MHRDLETYRVTNAARPSQPAPLGEPRVSFLGPQQDSALGWRVFGGVAVCAVVLGVGSLLLI